MRGSLVGLQLLLACALVLGSPVMEERKECCRPGVPPEESCCPKGNSTLEGLENGKGEMELPEQTESGLEELEELEELEGRARRFREMMVRYNEIWFEMRYWKLQALDYFNKHSPGAIYRPIEDMKIKAKSTTGTMLTFTLFLVDTNCTREEGIRSPHDYDSFSSMESAERVPCVALPKHQQRKLKCTFHMFMNGRTGASSVVDHFCEPLVIWEESEEMPDLDDLIHSEMRRNQHSEY